MLTAKLLNKSVVSSASADCSLCADTVGYELENCLCIVVKASYDCRVYCVFNICGVKIFFNTLEMLTAFVADVVKNLRCVLCNLRAYRAFSVQNSHRISFKS